MYSIKRVLGENLFSKKFRAQKVEAGLKVMLYNKFIRLFAVISLQNGHYSIITLEFELQCSLILLISELLYFSI